MHEQKTELTIDSLTIIIPIHIHASHWVALVRHIINGRVLFFYTDDMNSSNSATIIKSRFSTSSTSLAFHPSTALWITCPSFTYLSHSNECGPRTLLALSIVALSPNPTKDILLPYMHNNISQISRWWIAAAILRQNVNTTPFTQEYNHNPSTYPPPSWNLPADPAHLASLYLPGYHTPRDNIYSTTNKFSEETSMDLDVTQKSTTHSPVITHNDMAPISTLLISQG
jgi:hypothetical protein